jgi:hypothetical protein
MALEKKTGNKARLKYLLMFPLTTGLLCVASHAFSQAQPPPPQPPPPPGELLNRINPFKKHKKDTANAKIDTAKKAQVSDRRAGPPPPPNPADLFKRKTKKDTTKNKN